MQNITKKKENLAELLMVLLGKCNCDMSKINEEMWTDLVKLYKEIEDYG